MSVATRTLITAEILADCKKLEGVFYPTIGWNTIDYDTASQHNVMIINKPTWGNYAGLAEATVMLMSALLLELPQKCYSVRIMSQDRLLV